MPLNAHDRYLYEGNVLDELDRVKREQARAARQNINVNSLSEITDNGQSMDVTGSDYNSGRSVMGELGIDHEGWNAAEVYAATLTSQYNMGACVGLRMTDYTHGEYVLEQWQLPNSLTELIINNDFESQLANWTVTAANGTATAESGDAYSGSYYARLYSPNSDVTLTSDRITVTAGNHYLLSGVYRVPINSYMVQAYLNYYNAGGTLISKDTAFSFPGGAADLQSWTRFYHTSTAPTGATGVDVVCYLLDAQGGIAEVDFDYLSLMQADSVKRVKLSDLPATGPVLTVGPDHNRDGTSTFAAQIMVLRVARPITISGFHWIIRNSGNYALKYLYGPNIASAWETLWTGTASGSYGEENITLSRPLKLTPGLYYIGLQRTSGAATWCDYNEATYMAQDGSWMMDGIYYNTTGYSYVPAAKIVYTLND